jgi:hypothetical protein
MNNKGLTAFIGSMLAVVAGLYAYNALTKNGDNGENFSGRNRRMRMR